MSTLNWLQHRSPTTHRHQDGSNSNPTINRDLTAYNFRHDRQIAHNLFLILTNLADSWMFNTRAALDCDSTRSLKAFIRCELTDVQFHWRCSNAKLPTIPGGIASSSMQEFRNILMDVISMKMLIGPLRPPLDNFVARQNVSPFDYCGNP